LICPAFFEGGRLTIDDVHYVRAGDLLIPAAETESAHDAVFGYRQSNLRSWVEEKTKGRIQANDVASISIEEIRTGGPETVLNRLQRVKNGQPVVINAASYQDLYVVALAVIKAETSGQTFIYRTAASFVRARAGLPERPLLTRRDLLGVNAPPYVPGLVVVGSHVRRSSEQLTQLLELRNTVGIEVRVPDLLTSDANRSRVIREASEAAEEALAAGLTPVLFTSRQVVEGPAGSDPLVVSRAVSEALVEIVGRGERRPGFIVGKGGITSSDLGTKALQTRRAIVQGQVAPGVPVWQLGPEARFPGLPYVVFPGNVGEADTLADVVATLRGA
ncbi:MAG TPA: nucleotide-binding domain containing protein, partial [Thermomicrobiales bacterium]|nr:nucleotide-binding domain containing protein [Thermomicrobiales bacterium]